MTCSSFVRNRCGSAGLSTLSETTPGGPRGSGRRESRSGYCGAVTAEAACLMRAATAADCER